MREVIYKALVVKDPGNIFNKDPLRIRKLLLHRYEINTIEAKLKEKGLRPCTKCDGKEMYQSTTKI